MQETMHLLKKTSCNKKLQIPPVKADIILTDLRLKDPVTPFLWFYITNIMLK
jgi:hypothetical protein